jgi:hypothetical protein
MNILTSLPDDIGKSRGLSVIITMDRARESKTQLISRFIQNGSLFVVAGSEWLPASNLPHLLRNKTTLLEKSTDRLRLVRPSTCFRMLDSLANIPPRGEPILVLDFLHTFYDPDVPMRARLLRLRKSCAHLQDLSFFRPVIVITQGSACEDYELFFSILRSKAKQVVYLNPEPEEPTQPALF